MPDELTQEEQDELDVILAEDEPEGGEELQEQIEESKLEKKLSKKVDDLEKKFTNSVRDDMVEKFLAGADDKEQELFKVLASDVKTPENAKEAIELVKDRASKMRDKEAEILKAKEDEAEKKAASAWGVAPIGGDAPAPSDEEKKIMERINAGGPDSVAAAFESMVTMPPVQLPAGE